MSRLGAALVATSISLVTPAAAQDITTQVPSIVTTGEALVRRAPDLAFVSVTVESRAKNPGEAQRLNAEGMTNVQKRLTAAGIGKDAVRTLGYNVQQEFDFPNGRRVPREFVARNVLEVRVKQVDRLGEIIDTAVQSGATTVSGVRFDLEDRDAAERDALKMAVADARGRAEAAAAGAGRSIDRVLRIEENRQSVMPPPRQMMMARATDASVETPIEPGTIEIRAQVTLTVSIK